PASFPVVLASGVVLVEGTGAVNALDPRDGTCLWKATGSWPRLSQSSAWFTLDDGKRVTLYDQFGSARARLSDSSAWTHGVIAISPDGGKLFATRADATIFRVRTEDGAVEGTFCGHTGVIRGIRCVDEHRIASFGDDGTIKLWDSRSCGSPRRTDR